MTAAMESGQLIRTIRQSMGMSQNGLARAVGVTQQAVQRWEMGGAVSTLEHAWRLARLFEVEIEELFPWLKELAPPKVREPGRPCVHCGCRIFGRRYGRGLFCSERHLRAYLKVADQKRAERRRKRRRNVRKVPSIYQKANRIGNAGNARQAHQPAGACSG